MGDTYSPMADSNEQSKETVRIDVLPGSVSNGLDTKSRETVRIQLGFRQPSGPVLGSAAPTLASPEEPPPTTTAAFDDTISCGPSSYAG